MLASIARSPSEASERPVPADADDAELEKDAGFNLIEQRLANAEAPAPVLGQLADVPNAEALRWACDQLPDPDVAHVREQLVRVPWRKKQVGGQITVKAPGGSHFPENPPG